MSAADAYVQAQLVLARTPKCSPEPRTYGFPHCRTHSGGQFLDSTTQCDKAGREGALREALEALVTSLEVVVRPVGGEQS